MDNNRVVYGAYGTNTFPCPWCGGTRNVYVRRERTECCCHLCNHSYQILVCDNNANKLFMELIGENNNETA